MEVKEINGIVKEILYNAVEGAAGGSISEGQAVAEIRKLGYNFGYYETLNALKSTYKEIGLERTKPHTGQIICYYKPKKEPEKKTSKSIEMAIQSAHRATNEKTTAAIINNYRK